MRRNGHPSRPSAITCCRFSSLKTLLMPTKATVPMSESTSQALFSLAGFQVTIIGRFWVTAEGHPPITVARPNRCVAWCIFVTRHPASARTVRFCASTSTRLIPARSIITPPSHTPNPAELWPPHRTARGKLLFRANSRARATSSGMAQRTITAGCRS